MNARRLLGYNLLSAVVLGIVGFYVGWWLGHQITGPSLAYFDDTGQNDIALFLAYIVGVVGFLFGLGFMSYPMQRLLGKPPSLREKETAGPGRYFTLCTDHKVVGIQYLIGIGFFIFTGGVNAMLIRFELLSPTNEAFNANNYLTIVGLHGTMMMGMMTSGILGPFANYLVPIMIGARRMAFPRVEALTFWLLMLAGVILMTTVGYGGFPTGWTGYAPLNVQANMGMDSYIVFFALVGVSMSLLGLNVLATVITMRAPGLTWSRLPIFVWGVILDRATLMLLAAPVLISTLLMLLLDLNCARDRASSTTRPAVQRVPLLRTPLLDLRPPGGLRPRAARDGIVLEILPCSSHAGRCGATGSAWSSQGCSGSRRSSGSCGSTTFFVSGINCADLRPFLHGSLT